MGRSAPPPEPPPARGPSLSQFVLKVHSRCDLACGHRSVHEHADRSRAGRPLAMSPRTAAVVARRIAEHAAAHRPEAVRIVLHGCEPLRAGRAGLRAVVAELHSSVGPVAPLDIGIRTNGALLNERFCDLFAELGVEVGVSLDGDRAAYERHRGCADGRGGHDEALRAVALLNRPRYRHLFAGLLCTVDVRSDPHAVYDALVALDPPRVDFLLPHATWDAPPPRPEGAGPTPYADWLGAVHRRWDGQGRPVPVRLFESVDLTLRGGGSLTESLGLAPADVVVIETDGSYEQADSLKTAYDGAPATGMDVWTHSLDEVAAHPGTAARRQGLRGLCATCRACPVVHLCGGGLYAHRYRGDGSGFDNPSVFCPDLLALVEDIRNRTAPSPQAREPDITDAQLAELATGLGGGETVERLAERQLQINRDLLAEVWARSRSAAASPGAAAWELLVELDASAPGSVDRVLAHPYVRPWMVRCLQEGDATGESTRRGLAEVAAAAALHAGHDGLVTVPVHDGVLRLPTLGALWLDDTEGEPGAYGEVSVAGDGAGFRVLGPGGELLTRVRWKDDRADSVGGIGVWQPLRRIGPDGWPLVLEDTDPWRDVHEWPPAPRLTPDGCRAWAREAAAAWEWIRHRLPGYAPGVAAGLRAITPLCASDGFDVSAAARHSFGAVGIARPASPEVLASLIVHEFQHVKLGAVLDLVDLFDPSDERLFYAPWRPDPRPLEGLLQGTYAHLAVIDFWLARQRQAEGGGASGGGGGGAEARGGAYAGPGAGARQEAAALEAAAHFARWRDQTAEAVETLAGSGSLTAEGERFVAGMRSAVGERLAVPVDPRARAEGRAAALRHRRAWESDRIH
ncbi:FxsB family cyclophane-forming radical SAM/SPASM peptide maturase [Streptomyces sp. NPDC050504]|uniref:FxsB family cyclophane-forming radical SAM/SPASM peptide maturase n=1 Tax=Streptomyces sp. NPDC050504 TaxID=3365618 RepID=UPI0037A10786